MASCARRELLGRRVASATTSSLRDRRALCFRRPARAVLAGDHPGQPTRLHARCHSRARSGAARIPRSSRVRTGRGFDSRGVAIKTKSPTARGELFVLLVGRRHPHSRAAIGFRSMIQTRYPQYYPHSSDVIQKSESHQIRAWTVCASDCLSIARACFYKQMQWYRSRAFLYDCV
jgi:hypothetical protein